MQAVFTALQQSYTDDSVRNTQLTKFQTDLIDTIDIADSKSLQADIELFLKKWQGILEAAQKESKSFVLKESSLEMKDEVVKKEDVLNKMQNTATEMQNAAAQEQLTKIQEKTELNSVVLQSDQARVAEESIAEKTKISNEAMFVELKATKELISKAFP